MAKEDFIERYRKWTDEKLIESFKNRSNFQPDAIDAMLVVIKERNLKNVADTILAEGKRAAEILVEDAERKLKADQKRYVENFLKTTLDDVAYAKSAKGSDGIYSLHKVSAGKGLGLRTMLFSLLTITILVFVFGYAERPLFNHAQEISGGLSVAIIVYLYYLISSSKAKFSLMENFARKTVFELVHGNKTFTATVPFNYAVFSGEMEIRARGIKITHPLLYLFIENQAGEKIGLLENLTALQSAPPAWPSIWDSKMGKAPIYREVPFEKIELVRLKKILDGLHQQANVLP